MENFSFGSTSFLVIGALFVLSVLIFFWNRRNTKTNRRLKQRSFKQEYYAKKKQRKDEDA
jgi:LPXTG-motif cell wall-anchored protein